MQSRGEYLVGSTFNPSGDDMVAKLKAAAAAFIDAVDEIVVPEDAGMDQAGQILRLKALAVTEAESAAMWAVKAATKPPRI